MKNFAAHYIYIPDGGFFKQSGVSIDDTGRVVSVFALDDEVESVEWHPGVIVVLPASPNINNDETLIAVVSSLFTHQKAVFSHLTDSNKEMVDRLILNDQTMVAYLFFPFDFTSMKLDGETRHRQLR